MPDAGFPNISVGHTTAIRWPYSRRWVEQNCTLTDAIHMGFANRDEASIYTAIHFCSVESHVLKSGAGGDGRRCIWLWAPAR
jgi:hypothetical protein